jgi:Fe-S cluster assembly protein SufD
VSTPSTTALRAQVLAESRALAAGAPAWAARAREEAAAIFAERGLPTAREEDWRQTPLARLEQEPWDVSPAPRAELSRAALPAWYGEAHRAVFVDGVFAPALSSLEGATGASVRTLAEVLRGTSVPSPLMSLADVKVHTPSALCTALARDGAVIEVEDGASVALPLYIVHVQTKAARGHITCMRHAIRVGAGAAVRIVEHYTAAAGMTSDGGDAGAERGELGLSLTEVTLAPDANVSHVVLQERAARDIHVARLCVRQDTGSRFTSHSIALGARLSRFDIETALTGPGSHAELRGLYLAQGERHIDHMTTIDHASPDTTSREVYKGIAGARGRGVFCGRVHVRPDAQRIDAAQTSRGLLLDDSATLHARPQLEIYADDVRCSHGATIGALADDALFYLRARGIDAAAARAMLIRAFASDVYADLSDVALREQVDAELGHRLAGSPA